MFSGYTCYSVWINHLYDSYECWWLLGIYLPLYQLNHHLNKPAGYTFCIFSIFHIFPPSIRLLSHIILLLTFFFLLFTMQNILHLVMHSIKWITYCNESKCILYTIHLTLNHNLMLCYMKSFQNDLFEYFSKTESNIFVFWLSWKKT